MYIFQSLDSKTLKAMSVHNRGNTVHFCMGANRDEYSPASDLPSPLENQEPYMRGALSVTKDKGCSTASVNTCTLLFCQA